MSSSAPIDFPSLTLQDALDLATLIEEDARERYADFVAQLDAHSTPEAAAFFRSMVVNEAKHRDWLIKRRKALFGDAPTKVDVNMIFEIEAPSFSETDTFMSLRQALDVALRAEIRAHDFYADALAHVTDAKIKSLFKVLRDEETEHQHMVQREIDRLPQKRASDPHLLGDGPIAQ